LTWEAPEGVNGRDKQKPYSKMRGSHFITTTKKGATKAKGEEVRAIMNETSWPSTRGLL
jgi:hypothetical protein